MTLRRLVTRGAAYPHAALHAGARIATLLLVIVAPYAAAQTESAPAVNEEELPLIGTTVAEIRAPDDAPLNMPTAVAVAPDGRIFVVDGVNDRVVEFTPDAEFIAALDEADSVAFSRPVGAKTDIDGRVWIADTGNARIVVIDANGIVDRVIDLSQVLPDRIPDVTDLAFAANGASLWLTDNNHHTLLLYDLATGSVEVIGRPGEALAAFRFPFALAVRDTGDVLISDVLNGRVQSLNARGIPTRALGSYGVDLGQFHRPKGIALDAAGNVWIADSTLEVVQAFTSDGRFIGVLRDAAGRPIKFAHPMGVAFDADGALYVVELLADQVRKLEISGTGIVGRRLGPSRRDQDVAGGRQGQSCTVCHIEWMSPLVDGRGTELLDVPPNPPERPNVSRPKTCLGCHDGSVGDSRNDVWTMHGHRTGITPPPEIHVPDYLPLVDGTIQCRTCHSAHGKASPTGGVAEAVFLRIDTSPAELCAACHSQKAASTHGHPLGPMDRPLPESLLEHGSLLSPGENQVTCLVCHRAHGSSSKLMLAISPDRNELCLTCHENKRPGMFRDQDRPPHPLTAVLNEAQAKMVRDVGRDIGPDGQIICLSCHAMHQAAEEHYALAFPLEGSEACLGCHEEKQSLVASMHDLRGEFPEEANRLGLTVADAGPCSACHMFHQYARTPVAGDPIDPTGECVTCHQSDAVAQARMLGDVNHPTQNCVSCHNPHDPSFGPFLRQRPQDLCTTCHVERVVMVNGPHDPAASTNADAWPTPARETQDACLACHRPHGTSETGLFRVAPVAGAPPEEAACIACHTDAAPGSDSRHTLQHPRVVERQPNPRGEPLRATDDGHWQVGCTNCHDPHRDPRESALLLRGKGPMESEQLCLDCHPQLVSIHSIGPAKERLSEWGFESDACRPCHLVHADPAKITSRVLWPTELTEFPRPPASVSVRDDYCVTCHRKDGPVPPPEIASHPDVVMFNPVEPGARGYFPLFNARGEEDPAGNIACRTCHLTHGRQEAAVLPSQLVQMEDRELRARKFHIRTFEEPTVCNSCHGAGALRRFMYFHDPLRRTGALEARRVLP